MNLMSRKMKLIVFIFFATVAGLYGLSRLDLTIISKAVSPIEIVETPVPTIIQPVLKNSTMDSPDGKASLILDSRQTGDDITYSVFITSVSSTERQLIFGKELDASSGLSIPYNTWSPDNKYFFLKVQTQALNNYYVFFASGKYFNDDLAYLDIQKLFEQKVKGFIITDVTGWASPALLIVNTREEAGDKKVSYWFDVTNQSFTRLSTFFE